MLVNERDWENDEGILVLGYWALDMDVHLLKITNKFDSLPEVFFWTKSNSSCTFAALYTVRLGQPF